MTEGAVQQATSCETAAGHEATSCETAGHEAALYQQVQELQTELGSVGRSTGAVTCVVRWILNNIQK